MKPIFGKKNKKEFQCVQDEAGNVHCESRRRFEDGTAEVLSTADFTLMKDEHGNCKSVPSNLEEKEEGDLTKLSKKALPLLRQHCLTKPKDY